MRRRYAILPSSSYKDTYPDCRIYKLERNYRSCANILDVANKVIAHNNGRMGKKLWTETEGGPKVEYRSMNDDKSEAEFALELLGKLIIRVMPSLSYGLTAMRR